MTPLSKKNGLFMYGTAADDLYWMVHVERRAVLAIISKKNNSSIGLQKYGTNSNCLMYISYR